MDLSWLMMIAVVVVVYATLVGAGNPSKETAKLEIELSILKKINRMIDLITLRTDAELKDCDVLAARYQEEYDKLKTEVEHLKVELEEYKK